MLNVWSREFEENGTACKLPFIFPVCFYHGQSRWPVPLSLAEMIDAPEGIDDVLNGFAYSVRDLGAMDPRSLSRQPEVLAALWLAYKKDVPPDLLDLVTSGPVDGSDFQNHVLRYTAVKLNPTKQEMDDSLQGTKPDMREALAEGCREHSELSGVGTKLFVRFGV